MTIAPAGCLSLNQELLRTSLAACSTFQDLVGANSATAALTKIYHEGLPPPEGDEYTLAELRRYYPFAWVGQSADEGFVKDARGDGQFFVESGTLWLHIRREVPESLELDQAAADLEWKNIVGTIIDELCTLAGQGNYLCFHRVTVAGLYRNTRDAYSAQGQCQAVDLEFTWGPAQ